MALPKINKKRLDKLKGDQDDEKNHYLFGAMLTFRIILTLELVVNGFSKPLKAMKPTIKIGG